MTNEATPSEPQLMFLTSPRSSDTEVPQPNQVRVSNSPPIPIHTTQSNNLITPRHLITIYSQSNIFKSR